jgi:hypothetical protein
MASRGIRVLAGAQNADGGWDAEIWGRDIPTPVGVWSFVPSTSFAVQALAATGDMAYRDQASRALAWLVRVQNEDGSWNFGSCQPGVNRLTGFPNIVRTCEALQGIIAARTFDVGAEGLESAIASAVEWIRAQEQPIFDSDRKIAGWGWADYENTCLTVETLAKLPESFLPMLSPNARWLVDSQTRRDNDPEDGNWPQGHTARIALSLIEFYKRVRAGEQGYEQTR